MKKGITVIVPCYNTAAYIEKCMESILKQTFSNLEIILVDDKSPDETWSIIQGYAEKYENVIALQNQKNSGAGHTRNYAIKKATYDYIGFIDSDDTIEPNYYEELMQAMEDNDATVSICDIYVRYQSETIQDVRSQMNENGTEKISFVNNGLAASPCNKLFRKQDLVKYPFAEGIMNEDIPTVMSIIINAEKVGYTENTYYNYIQRENSVQNEFLSDRKLAVFQALNLLETRIPRNEENEEYWNAIIYNQINMFIIYVIPKEPSFLKRRKFLKKFYHFCRKYDIRKNHFWWDFLASQGRYHKIYYRLYFKIISIKFYSLASSLISFYHFYHKHVTHVVIKENIVLEDIINMAKKQASKKKDEISISVVIPNYNYEKFMLERVYSILYQTKKINEIIFLDDCSKDNSCILMDQIMENISPYIQVKKLYNDINSGIPFKQWEKGFMIAKCDYVWIAEADDYCDSKFLKSITNPIKKNHDIVISYADTAYINATGKIILRSIKCEIDIEKTGHWNHHFISQGKEEIEKYEYLNCTIANVSSVLFKRDDYSKELKLAGKYRQGGDWLFYYLLMKKGQVSYYNCPLNYYRVHGNNVTSTNKKQLQMDEIRRIHNYMDEDVRFSPEQKRLIEKRYEFLKKVWHVR